MRYSHLGARRNRHRRRRRRSPPRRPRANRRRAVRGASRRRRHPAARLVSPTGRSAILNPPQTIDAPARATRLDAPLDVMVEPVSQAEYARCVAAAACPKLKAVDPTAGRPASRRRQLARRHRLRRMVCAPDRRGLGVCRPTTNGPTPPPSASTAIPPPAARDADFAARWLAKFDADSALPSQNQGPAAVRPFRPQQPRASPTFRQMSGNGRNSCYEPARSRRPMAEGARADPQLPRPRAQRASTAPS